MFRRIPKLARLVVGLGLAASTVLVALPISPASAITSVGAPTFAGANAVVIGTSAGVNAAYTMVVAAAVNIAVADAFVVTFPAGTHVGTGSLTVAGAGTIGTSIGGTIVTSATGGGTRLVPTITLVAAAAINAGNINFVLGSAAGVVHPVTPGAAYTLSVAKTVGAAEATANSAAYTITANPILAPATASSATQITLAFTSSAQLTAGVDVINSVIPSGFTLPATIDKSRVAINGVVLTTDPTVSVGVPPGSAGTITMTIPDMDGATAGMQHIAAGAITLVYSSLAGIVTPASANTHAASYSFGVFGPTGLPATLTPVGRANVTRNATVSGVGTSSRSGTVTVSGRGYTANGTATLWLDNAAGSGVADNAIIDGTETTLATVTTGADGTFTATFSPANTSIFVGQGAFRLNARDINGRAIGWLATGISTGTQGSLSPSTPTADSTATTTVLGSGSASGTAPTLSILGSVYLTPSSATRGSIIAMSISDYSVAITSATLGGLALTLTTTSAFASGAQSVTFTVPLSAPIGVNSVLVLGGAAATSDNRAALFTVTAAPVTAVPNVAVANQSISLSGSSFTTGGAATIAIGAIKVDGAAAGLPTTAIAIDNGGTWAAQITLPTVAVIASLAVAGTHTLTITDSAGVIGEAVFTISSPSVVAAPTASGRGTLVTLNMKGFAASTALTITYGATSVGGVTTDGSGNASASLTVPLTAAIPSDNTIAVSGGSTAGVVTHSVPTATITVSPSTGAPGTVLTIKGLNFPAYSPVSNILIGGISALPAPAPASDGFGAINATILIPQVAAGTAALLMTAGGASANVAVIISAAATTAASSLAPLGTNLVRVWGDIAGVPVLYDPLVPTASDLKALVRGQGYWVKVVTAQTVTLGSFTYTLLAGWNNIGWQG